MMASDNWTKYKQMCTIKTHKVPVKGGQRQIEVHQITPEANILESRHGYVYAHQGGGLMFDNGTFLLEGCRIAVLFKAPVFLVDYNREKEVKTPNGILDLADAIEYINDRAETMEIK